MTPNVFFEQLQQQWDAQLPFVVYRKPKATTVCAFLQKDTTLHKTRDYVEKGFVFAPFDLESDAILIPDTYRIQIENKAAISHDFHTGIHHQKESRDIQAAKYHHIATVNKAMKHLNDGTLTKVVLSRKETLELSEAAPIAIFQRLLGQYPTAMVYCWYHPRIGLWLGASPETLLHIEEDRFYTMALAGTQPYKGSINVSWGIKEKEEQAMVLEEISKELVSLVTDLECSKTYTHQAGKLLHLRTDIKGKLKENSVRRLIGALHPTPAVCGLPKQNAKTFIVQNENYNREFYTGFLGEMNLGNASSGYTTLFVNLRCMQLQGNRAHIYVGGGITKASIPEKEWEETIGKTSTIRVVL